MRSATLLLFISIIFSSCAQHLLVDYSEFDNLKSTQKEIGTLSLVPSRPTEKTSITVNDKLIVLQKYTKSVTIVNIPEGSYNVLYTVGSGNLKDDMNEEFNVNVVGKNKTTKLLVVPQYSNGYWIYVGIASGVMLLSSLLTSY
tara:strand:- start:134 stop:562 length:429 start_codon:yes stop_codon:yes gene_type:complete